MFRSLFYIPKNVTDEKSSIAVIVIEGGDSTSDQFTTWSIKFARRGYIVLDFDKLREGYSESVAGIKELGNVIKKLNTTGNKQYINKKIQYIRF